VLDVRNPAVDEDEIDRSVACDLIGDMEIAAPRERWLRECNPTSYRDRVTGVTRVIYAKRGCEYGP
jgi:hypothetical protein